MVPLPIDAFLPEITARLRESRALVLVAEPGAGKTTRVPPAVLRAGLLGADHPNVVMLQPRRVAARASAQRIAEENGWELGGEVGYHVRFDKRIGPRTRLRVLTEGILTRQLLDDPFLEGVGAVVLDEFHERSLHTDVTVALLREVRQTVREDLMLIVMSATLDAEPVAKFLGDCPVVRLPGRAFPVEMTYSLPSGEKLPDRVASAVRDAIEHDSNDLLVFLPGAEEIRRSMQRLEPLAQGHDLLLLPLHGSLPAEEQNRALRPARQRKVILATNVAETSLTIDGVGTVIDSGLARIAGYDPQRGLDRLDLKRISKASATQRAGRAGRTGPGRCVRLWTQREEQAMADYELPEVRRVDLAGTVLALHAWGKPDPRAFGWFEPPPEQTLVAAERLLAMLGALDSETGGSITPLGRAMMAMPVHPRLGRLLLGAAEMGRLEAGAAVAALLSEKDILAPAFEGPRPTGPKTQGRSDLTYRLELLAEAERSRFGPSLRDRGVDPVAARQVARTRDELLRIARHLKARPRGPDDEDVLLKLPLLAYPDRVCRRRASDPAAGVMVGGGGVRLSPESVVRQDEFFLALDARHDDRSMTREALVRVAGAIDVQWLDELFPGSVRRERQGVYDEHRDRVVGRGVTLYLDLPLREDADAPVDAATAGKVLAGWAVPRADELLRSDDAAQRWLARRNLLDKAMPEHRWPAPDRRWARESLAAACQGRRSLNELRPQLVGLLRSMLEYPLDRIFETEAPETIEVPSGNRIRLDYPDQDDYPGQVNSPTLSVRLQELFGWTDTPRIGRGRVPVKLELLGPNYRPVQVTEDLRNFWATTYFQVRKDLRARYPKHSWPEDPLSARPEAKGGRRR